MSGDWIKMRDNLGEDPAVIAIADSLHLSRDAVIGKLYRLWAWADQHTEDGIPRGVKQRFVDEFVGKPGFADAMRDAGWLNINEGLISFPHFDRHNGASAKSRAQDTKRKQVGRSSDIDPHSVLNLSGSKPDKSVTREEKRREDQKQKRATAVALPIDFRISERVRTWAAEKGHDRLEQRLEHFVGYAKRCGKRYVDWDEAFMSAIREDWAKLGEKPAPLPVGSVRVAL